MKKLFRKNKKTIFNKIYENHSQQLFLLILRYVVSQFDAEEVLQRGFIKVYEALDDFTYENDKASLGWLKRIMVNESLLFLREQKRLTLSDNISFNETSSNQSPEVENKLGMDDCLSLVRNLPDGYRTVFNLYVIEGYAHKEIAEILHISESASRSQLTRARNILKSQLKSLNYATELVG